jgi:hypothetical protein
MTGVRAKGRIAPAKPMRPGRTGKAEFEYKRHGARRLMGNFEAATGQVIAPTAQATRGETDFAARIRQAAAAGPEAGRAFAADDLTAHASAALVPWVASVCGTAAESPGEKGKGGVPRSVATRKAFLTEAGHRVRFVCVPRHTSWLNQVEIWFGVLARRVPRRGAFRSAADPREKALAYIAYYNRTRAKPYKWACAGRPLNV